MHLLLIEDDARLAELIIKGFNDAGCSIDHALNGTEGLATALAGEYEAYICDLMLPGMDGFSIIEALRKQRDTTPILILSAKQSVDERVRGLQVGGDDYLVKPFAFTELLARVQALVRRAQGYRETTALEVGDLRLDLVTREVHRGMDLIDLQNREYELLAYLMQNSGRVVSRLMIIQNVWNFNFDPQTNIVEARMSKLREKIDKPYHRKLLHTIRGAGYVLKAEGS